LLFAFGIVFELPVVAFFLSKMGIVTPEFLKKKRKYALLLTFVLAAILTPPDVITQLMMAGPLILLYEIGIFVARMARRKKDTEQETTDEVVEG
ncbi:MAG: twin-arginine translocase subunit TatC, partial [Desulfobacteraceae bacterium]